MWRYELKKVFRQPVFAILFLFLILAKIATALIFTSANPESLQDKLIRERYAGIAIEEAAPHVLEDYIVAQEQVSKRLDEEYQSGKISLDELRVWQNAYPERIATEAALDALNRRVDALLRYADMRDQAKEGKLANEILFWTKEPEKYLDQVGQWKQLSLIPERGWHLYFELESMGWISFIFIFLLIPQFTELRYSGMESVLRSTGRGLTITKRIKLTLSISIVFAMWLIDSLMNIVIPITMCGLSGFDWAAQSISELVQLPFPFTLGEYLLVSSLCRLAGALFIYLLCHIVSKFISNTAVALGVTLCIWMAAELLFTQGYSPNMLFYPVKLLCQHMG